MLQTRARVRRLVWALMSSRRGRLMAATSLTRSASPAAVGITRRWPGISLRPLLHEGRDEPPCTALHCEPVSPDPVFWQRCMTDAGDGRGGWFARLTRALQPGLGQGLTASLHSLI